ncbi:MAG TPA: periplasmic heavy metal sensor [Armatimonadota bacterium]|nr:periplasmic heavy metal sensor [Armatimonadota bacterium]
MRLSSAILAIMLAVTAAHAAPQPPPGHGGPAGARGGCPMMGMPRAQAGRGGHGAMAAVMAPVRLLLMHRDMLNLTDDQVSRLTSLHAENQKQMARRLADAYAAHIDLMQALTRPDPDRRAVETAVRALGQAVTEFMLTQSRAYVDALQVLTPAQRQQFQRMASLHASGQCPQCRGMMGGMGGMMGGMAPPTAPPPAEGNP